MEHWASMGQARLSCSMKQSSRGILQNVALINFERCFPDFETF